MNEPTQRGILVTDRRGQPVGWSQQYAAESEREREFALRRMALTKRDSLSRYGAGSRVYNPDDLLGKKGMTLIDEMLIDEQIGAIMDERKDDVVTAGMQIVATGEVTVDEVQELRKTAKIRAGQVVRLDDIEIHVLPA